MTTEIALHSRVALEGLGFPEGIRWHGDRIWFSDLLALNVTAWDPVGKTKEIVASFPDKPSGLGFLPDQKLLIVTMGRLKMFRLDAGGPTVVADLRDLCGPSCHLNDMVVDGRGRAYIGGLDNGDHSDRSGKILLLEPGGGCRVAASDMAAPNGMAITPDGKTLFACDSSDKTLTAFDVAEDGTLNNRRLFADFGEAIPDGICLDADGAAWIGFPFKGEFRRIRSDRETTHRIAYEDRLAVAPALGGTDRRTLYLCTAHRVPLDELKRFFRNEDTTPSQDAIRRCNGAIEIADGAPLPGAGWP